ncbi:MAG: hypothetical protein WA919_08080 [Coleofasciculaceae cyanobacterium]
MSTDEKTRELLTEKRHHDQHRHETMLNRAEAELENSSEKNKPTQEQARELLTEQRQHEEDLQEKMLDRAEAEIEVS